MARVLVVLALALPLEVGSGITDWPTELPGFRCEERTNVTREDWTFDEHPVIINKVCARWVKLPVQK